MSKKTTSLKTISLVFILLLIFVAGFFLLSSVQKKARKEVSDIIDSLDTVTVEDREAETADQPKPAQMYFFPAVMEVKKGQDFSVELKVNTFEQTSSGIDVVLQYDKNLLEFKEARKVDDFNLVLPVQAQENTTFSLLSPPGKRFQGEVKVADIYFTALDTGTAQVSFITELGSTMDTNIASPNGDILGRAEGVTVRIID